MQSKRHLKWLAIPTAFLLAITLSGCTTQEFGRGFLPGTSGITNHTDEITALWTSSWIILWLVGLIAWGLMGYAMVVYRRRKGETGLPVQLRYNMPIETLFTVVPLILVVGFFAFTTKVMMPIETPVKSDMKIEAIGKQWSWDFNYLNNNVYETGIQFDPTEQTLNDLPTLYLPVNKSVEVDLTSRDVIHSFWVIDFLYKKDVFPGRTNKIFFTPQKIGTYEGKCAELCGEYHSMMLFRVKVVSQADFDTHVAELAAKGQTGSLGIDLNRNQNLPGDNPSIRG
ncbi:MAG: cytochrome c oxidase subunit II [Actinomycetes bacterium]